jgi:hypothetical protein
MSSGLERYNLLSNWAAWVSWISVYSVARCACVGYGCSTTSYQDHGRSCHSRKTEPQRHSSTLLPLPSWEMAWHSGFGETHGWTASVFNSFFQTWLPPCQISVAPVARWLLLFWATPGCKTLPAQERCRSWCNMFKLENDWNGWYLDMESRTCCAGAGRHQGSTPQPLLIMKCSLAILVCTARRSFGR